MTMRTMGHPGEERQMLPSKYFTLTWPERGTLHSGGNCTFFACRAAGREEWQLRPTSEVARTTLGQPAGLSVQIFGEASEYASFTAG